MESLVTQVEMRARKRLEKLYSNGQLDFKKIGNSKSWWITEEGKEYLCDES